MALDAGTRSRLDAAVATARSRNDFPAIDDALADLVDAAAGGDRDALDFLLQLIDRHRLAAAAVRTGAVFVTADARILEWDLGPRLHDASR